MIHLPSLIAQLLPDLLDALLLGPREILSALFNLLDAVDELMGVS